MTEVKLVTVWDRTVRVFHWVNFLCVLGLIVVGTVILNAGTLGIPNDGKILLKSVHVLIGYVFALNLLWRLVWAFVGGRHARWRAILPGGRGYVGELRGYLSRLGSGRQGQYLGHNPLGRIAIFLLLLLLLNQAVTGLVLAGTDLFYPPLGSWIAGWIAAAGVDPATLVPYAPEMYEETAYQAMRAFRKPFITAHYYGFYTLLVLITLHILAVVVTEVREDGGLVSAMFTGKKAISAPPADRD
ncbi:cytochrome b/b6 domain-containing protein [Elongatibacter sediminis]|uniref:Cytochrome b/b6 domain-containing protein n=1 Tax=Elongatibacter sediminis TaxID=3119006 RepID=A0AAW9RC23_9GAMM